ncbi:CCHC-type domain-containing protein [Trichonephila clavata]|uniref:CCHC-type domain-containing protein n=1 Tax=Trichonephila clavata TaxID=2740835 RepID=A0A8X6F5Y8_TRICU|nr:CCHC-type domain-containing protein [Trichonephila clavata]
MPYDPSRFKMTVTLRLPKKTKRVNPSIFDNFILKQVGKENVEILRPLSRSNEWELVLKSEAIREKLLRMGKAKIKKWTCWIFPFCSMEIRGHIHWLPNAISNDEVKEFLSQYGQVIFVENRTPPNWDSTIANESRYYALYLDERVRKWDIPHFKKFNNFLCLITIRGRTPACFHCRVWGHKKSQCKTRQIKFDSYCHQPHCSESGIQNELDNTYIISNDVETTSGASSSTITSLVEQQVCMEGESFIANNSTSVKDNTSEIYAKIEATYSTSFPISASLTSQACAENEHSTALISLTVANGTSQICFENKPSISTLITSTECNEIEQYAASSLNTASLVTPQIRTESEPAASSNSITVSFATPQVCTEGEPAAAFSSTTASLVTPQVHTEGEPAAASSSTTDSLVIPQVHTEGESAVASSSTTASLVTPQVHTEGESAVASSSTTASLVTPQVHTEGEQAAETISNSAILEDAPEVCIKKEVNIEFSSTTSAEGTPQICSEKEASNNSYSESETVSTSRDCFVWKPTDDDIKLEKQIFLAIHILGKWKMATDELTESRLQIQ